MLAKAVVLLGVLEVVIAATDVQRCSGSKPPPLQVTIDDCTTPPCPVYRGKDARFVIQFVAHKYITNMTTKARATSLGITIPYELPADVKDVCINLLDDAYCPLYPTEDVTYLIDFPIGAYPEVAVKVEVSIVDQDGDVTMCFKVDLKVHKAKMAAQQAPLHDRFASVTSLRR